MDGYLILLLSFGTPVFIIGIILFIIRRSHKRNAAWAKQRRERQEQAYPVNARIITARQGLGGGSIRSIVHFSFEILDSHSPYRANASWFVESLYFPQCQPGAVISVKVDRDDKSIIYPDMPWAVYSEGYDKLPGI